MGSNLRPSFFADWNLALTIAWVSRGVARLWHVPNEAGTSEENLFKNAKGRLYYFLLICKFVSVVVYRLESRSLVHVGNLC